MIYYVYMSTPSKEAKEAKKFNFGQAFDELEKITAWFEREGADLDEGLKKFERGLELAKKLKSRLAEVEHKVVEIKKKFGESE